MRREGLSGTAKSMANSKMQSIANSMANSKMQSIANSMANSKMQSIANSMANSKMQSIANSMTNSKAKTMSKTITRSLVNSEVRPVVKVLSAFAVLFSICTVSFCTPASCQSAGPRTVGDGTVFLFSPGKSEGYGIYSGDIGGSVGVPLYTRHHRLGQSTGIGASTLETTSATSESTPAAVNAFAPAASQFTLNRPALPSPFQGMSASPALGGNTVSPAQGLYSGNGLYSGSGLTSPYAEMRSPFSTQMLQQPTAGVFQDMDTVPSFIKQHTKAVLPLSGTGNDQVFSKVQPQF